MPEDLEGYSINFEPTPYFKNIHDFYFLTKINYPFSKEDLEYYEWDDLSYFARQMEVNTK